MAMNKDRLGDKMTDAVIALTPGTPIAGDVTQIRTLMRALAKEIIDEFIGFAEIESDGNTETHGTGAEADIIDLQGVVKA